MEGYNIMVPNNEGISAQSYSFSTDEICRGSNETLCLTDELDRIDFNITS